MCAAWLQGLFFSAHDSVRWGLTQLKGGPCGVIASVQVARVRVLVGCSVRFQLPAREGVPSGLFDPVKWLSVGMV